MSSYITNPWPDTVGRRCRRHRRCHHHQRGSNISRGNAKLTVITTILVPGDPAADVDWVWARWRPLRYAQVAHVIDGCIYARDPAG